MPIQLPCPCGNRTDVNDEYAGKRVKCSSCGRILLVPLPTAMEPLDVLPVEAADTQFPKAWEHSSIWKLKQLVVLTREFLLEGATVSSDAKSRVEKGQPPDGLFTPGFKKIPLDGIRSVQTDKHEPSITVEFAILGRLTKTHNFILPNLEMRDEIFQALEESLKPIEHREIHQFGRLRATVAPVVALCACSALMAACYGAALTLAEGEEPNDTGGSFIKVILIWLAKLLGPTGVIILSIIMALGITCWAVARVRKPPLMITIRPRRREKHARSSD